MILVIDTSIIVADYRLEQTSSRRLLDDLQRAGILLHVPEVVLLETVNKFRQAVSSERDKALGASNKLARLQGHEPPTPTSRAFVQEATEEYEAHLRRRIHAVGGYVAPIPEIPHRTLVERAIRNRKPFSKQGGAGYRDALIWLSVVHAARSTTGKVYFLSANVQDFGRGPLHPDLQRDLDEVDVSSDRVVYFSKTDEFVRVIIEPNLNAAKKHSEALRPSLALAIEDALVDLHIDPLVISLPDDVLDLQVQRVISIDSYDFGPQPRLSQDTLEYQLRVECRCLLGGFMDKLKYVALPGSARPSIWENGWDDSLVAITIDADMTFTGTVRVLVGDPSSPHVSMDGVEEASLHEPTGA